MLWKHSIFKGCEFPRVLYIGREVAPMTAADIIMIFIGVIGLLIAFGSFVIALLAFLDRDKDHKRKK